MFGAPVPSLFRWLPAILFVSFRAWPLGCAWCSNLPTCFAACPGFRRRADLLHSVIFKRRSRLSREPLCNSTHFSR